MPFRFGKRSSDKLATCHPTLVAIAQRALETSPYDFSIIHGWRGEDVQNGLFDSNASTKRWPDSMHNHTDPEGRPLSLAIDFAPYINGKIPWNETHIFAVIAGLLFAAAQSLGAQLRWGGDWDTDGNTREHKLQDWGHMEIIL
jgi:peptidoglycan L-alanyl-D-glutamate endopeptidase CwlK